jgi:hypothetical protein
MFCGLVFGQNAVRHVETHKSPKSRARNMIQNKTRRKNENFDGNHGEAQRSRTISVHISENSIE